MAGSTSRPQAASLALSEPRVEIRRSKRRRRTVSARLEGDTVVVLMPEGLSETDEADLVEEMVGKLRRKEQRARSRTLSDAGLSERAARLSREWLDGRAEPRSVRWVGSMRTRWASCTPAEGTIRVSELLERVPPYVLDYVLVHELAHLIVPGGHSPQFWETVHRYPKTQRALGYLEAYATVTRNPQLSDGAEDVDDLPSCEEAG